MTDFEPAFDLLGDPIPPNFGRRGRPQHVPTQENRNKIILLLAQGWTDPRISGALGITVPTLRKHYFRELRTRDIARDRVEAIGLLTFWNQGREGNTAAMKEYFRRHDASAELAFREEVLRQNKPDKPEKIGKKAQADLDAQQPPDNSEWSKVLN